MSLKWICNLLSSGSCLATLKSHPMARWVFSNCRRVVAKVFTWNFKIFSLMAFLFPNFFKDLSKFFCHERFVAKSIQNLWVTIFYLTFSACIFNVGHDGVVQSNKTFLDYIAYVYLSKKRKTFSLSLSYVCLTFYCESELK